MNTKIANKKEPGKRHPQRLPKHQWIYDIGKGKTFADIGGLWGTINETISIADKAGAKKVSMIDIQPLNSKWWALLNERCKELNVTGYDTIVGNICDANIKARIGKFDVVHCSGILYHVSDPIAMIRNLVSITNDYLIIGSMLIPERIKNSKGTLLVQPGVMYNLPTMRNEERQILGEYFSSINVKVGGLNQPEPVFVSKNLRLRSGPWWYLYTAETMRRMCELFDLTVEDSWVSRQGAQNLLCKISQ